MHPSSQVRLVGRRTDRPHSLLLRDEDGRYFLRPSCGSRLVRITSRDAEMLMRQSGYNTVLDADWHSSTMAETLGCVIPDTVDLSAHCVASPE